MRSLSALLSGPCRLVLACATLLSVEPVAAQALISERPFHERTYVNTAHTANTVVGNALAVLPLSADHLPAIPGGYTYSGLGIFCKLDVQFERHLPFPVLIRLGDVQQVEAWEGKGPLAPPHR
ncbi:MAG: hypothetical protein KDC00_02510 [Flavobacteriales bacterium]|nr:hypothetical protein [Flavobacteriales bacterium]